MKFSLHRLAALTKKEFLELVRDKSSLLMGVVVPIMMVFLIGYGVSLDVEHARVTVVLEDFSPTAHDVVSFMDGSRYLDPVYVTNMHEALQRLDRRQTEAILRIPSDFSSELYRGEAKMQLLLQGTDTTTAMSIQGYVESGVNMWVAQHRTPSGKGTISVENRVWFNDANSSTWYTMPGLIMMIITMIGVMLTATVMAREYERGTFESLFVTAVRPLEVILSKIIPYFCVACMGVVICFLLTRYLFRVPVMGSIMAIITLSMFYLFLALALGLIISVQTKSQFLADQLSVLVSMMPCMILSGYIFDLRNTPLVVRLVGRALPFSHYLACLKSLFLAGNIWNLILHNGAILLVYSVVAVGIALSITKKKVE